MVLAARAVGMTFHDGMQPFIQENDAGKAQAQPEEKEGSDLLK